MLQVHTRRVAGRLQFQNIELPSAHDLGATLKHFHHSAPGRDGIPHAAWQALPREAAKTLHPIMLHLATFKAPVGFNDQNVIFPPKKIEEAEGSQVTRSAAQLRTISLRNTDNKIVATTMNRAIIPATLDVTQQNQRVFCPGRQFPLMPLC